MAFPESERTVGENRLAIHKAGSAIHLRGIIRGCPAQLSIRLLTLIRRSE